MRRVVNLFQDQAKDSEIGRDPEINSGLLNRERNVGYHVAISLA